MANGTFVLADIGGYTTFLSDVGIEHAKEITSHLFNGMVKVNDRWKVGNVEGDCLFLYSSSPESPEGTFDEVRKLYESFRDSVAEVASGSTCRCGACDRSGDLALKFVVHSGEFDIHEVAGRQELIGSDIVVAHRLLKNSVPVREYALFTTPLADVASASGLKAILARDEYGDIGAVDYLYVDLQPLREAFEKSREVYVTKEDADVFASIEIEAPPELVWSVFKDREKGPQMFPTLVELEPISGEYGEPGGVHTCLHGGGLKVVHLVVAHDEAGRRHTERLWGLPIVNEGHLTMEVKPSPVGAICSVCYAFETELRTADEAAKSIFVRFVRNSQKHTEADLQGLKALCEAEAQAKTTTAKGAP